MLYPNSRRNPFPPSSEAGRIEFLTHNFFNLALRNSELSFNGIKRGAVFPSHFYDSVNFGWSEYFQWIGKL
jgi:hypothetical protein